MWRSMPDIRIGNERVIVSGLVGLLLVLWLGFLVHVDPRWPGSLIGSAIGIAAALLMQAPFLYLMIKRIGPLRRMVTRRVPMGRLLAWHIYGGIVGPILALIHSGHKFDSALGVALVTVMLIEVAERLCRPLSAGPGQQGSGREGRGPRPASGCLPDDT